MKHVVLVAWLVGCAVEGPVGSHGAAVVDGTVGEGDPAVVALVPRRSRCDAEPRTVPCSGVLIAPRVVLTAAHCFEIFGRQGGSYEVFFGGDVRGGEGRFVVGEEIAIHPDYDAETYHMDVALLRLAEDPGVTPMPVSEVPLDEGIVGAVARVVGFGVTRDDAMPDGIKREGTTRITALEPEAFRAEADPSMTCQGDSGGPVLVDRGAGEELVGMTVRGDPGCRSEAVNARLDVLLDGFIRPFVDETGSLAPRGTGGILAMGDLCTAPCGSSSDCPFGMVCQAGPAGGECRLSMLAPGTFGEACASDAECGEARVCARLWPEGADACRCHEPCADMGMPGGDDGGCAAAGGGTAGWPWLLAILCILRGGRNWRDGPRS